MTEKICDFCGESIAGGLQEHDFATCAHNLKDKVMLLKAENGRLVNYLLKLRRKAELDYMGIVSLGVKAIDKALGGE